MAKDDTRWAANVLPTLSINGSGDRIDRVYADRSRAPYRGHCAGNPHECPDRDANDSFRMACVIGISRDQRGQRQVVRLRPHAEGPKSRDSNFRNTSNPLRGPWMMTWSPASRDVGPCGTI